MKAYYGSIELEKIKEALQDQTTHVNHKNGKTYLNINFSINDQLDQYGNIASVSIPTKDPNRKRMYIGNMKESVPIDHANKSEPTWNKNDSFKSPF